MVMDLEAANRDLSEGITQVFTQISARPTLLKYDDYLSYLFQLC
jgi:hypothetical protein